ncbi:MAG: alpha-amylase family glycosyl hydrolase [Polyangiaceae bacterium]
MLRAHHWSRSVLSSFALAGLLLGGCAKETFFDDTPPEDGSGGFNPGQPSTGSSYGYGAQSNDGGSGTGGSMDPPPPMCDDELKRCERVVTYADAGEQSVEIRGSFSPDGWTVGVPMTKTGSTWSASLTVPWNTDVEYKFVLNGSTWIADPANPTQVSDGFGGFNSVLAAGTCPDDFTCDTPVLGFDWRDAVMYFVLVDRFVDGNPANNGPSLPGVEQPAAYRGGDWAGLKSKIDEGYFEGLGVNTLWLSVPVDNADVAGVGDDGHQYSAYHGYWPKDLSTVEGRFGTKEELAAVVDSAHTHNLKVIVDYAMNHVHISSPVYADHPDWFWPLQNGNQYCVCGAGCSWDGAEGKRCWFRDYLPDFNFTNATARAYSVDNAITWAQELGFDGFRLDAVKHIEDSWLLDLRARIKSDIEPATQQHFYLVGETFTGDKGLIGYYVNPSTMLDGQFDFPLRAQVLRSMLVRNAPMSDLDGFLTDNIGFYGSGVMSTFIGNHDVPRVIHFAEDAPLWNDAWAGGKERAWSNQPGLPGGQSAFERVANAFTLLYTIPGIPLVYYGDEVGMAGAGDPDNRRMMQWSGYSSGQTFLKARLAKLGTIRAAHPALRRGTRTSLGSTNDTLVFKMSTAGDEVYVVINRGDGQASVGGLPSQGFTDELDGSSVSGPSVSVPARSARILVAQ